jgi:DNA-binding transcriptional MerR regulator
MIKSKQNLVSIGEASARSGMSVRRVRYLSDQGYIQKPVQSISGAVTYRLYTEAHIQQLKKIKAFQDDGYTLEMAVKKMKEEHDAKK